MMTQTENADLEVWDPSGNAPTIRKISLCVFILRVGFNPISHGGDLKDPQLYALRDCTYF